MSVSRYICVVNVFRSAKYNDSHSVFDANGRVCVCACANRIRRHIIGLCGNQIWTDVCHFGIFAHFDINEFFSNDFPTIHSKTGHGFRGFSFSSLISMWIHINCNWNASAVTIFNLVERMQIIWMHNSVNNFWIFLWIR